ncbi:hypothetical protein ACX80I_13640, partial [Arthrobacter sp. MDT3-44]
MGRFLVVGACRMAAERKSRRPASPVDQVWVATAELSRKTPDSAQEEPAAGVCMGEEDKGEGFSLSRRKQHPN